jgi:hypothetical protein
MMMMMMNFISLCVYKRYSVGTHKYCTGRLSWQPKERREGRTFGREQCFCTKEVGNIFSAPFL